MGMTLLQVVLDELGTPLRDLDGGWNLLWRCPFCNRVGFLVVDDGIAFVCRKCHHKGGLLEYLRKRHPRMTEDHRLAMAGIEPQQQEPDYAN